MDGQPENTVPMATAVAVEFQLHFGFSRGETKVYYIILNYTVQVLL